MRYVLPASVTVSDDADDVHITLARNIANRNEIWRFNGETSQGSIWLSTTVFILPWAASAHKAKNVGSCL